ncbi:ABC transporter permease [Oscillospiraceae bacterium PP1C4]
MAVSTDSSMLVSKKYAKRSQMADIWRNLKKNKGAIIGLIVVILLVLMALFAGVIYDYEKDVIMQNISERLQSPSLEHPFGTDEVGRDIMARVIYGARYSLPIGMVAVIVAVLLGVTLGAIAGYYGGMVENLLMRFADVFASIPHILLAIVVVSVLGQSTLNLMIAVGVTSTPAFIRVARAAVLTVRNQEYIEAARAIGVKNWKIILFHILPNSLSPIIVQTTLRVGSAIISASSLCFLGLGVPAPAPEWGGLLAAGRKYIRDYSYMTLFPGLAIMVTVLALNLLGDGLRDAMDPKMKR